MEFVALLLILFGAFQSFVVPTGSMAPTIRGYHKVVVCPDCKIRVLVNASSEADGRFADMVTGCTCANCQRTIDFAKDNLRPALQGGDRILVSSTTPKEPRRFDLMTFRNPPRWLLDKAPDSIYVARLIGLPGETLAFQEGRIYRSSAVKYKKNAQVKADELWMREHARADDPRAIELFEGGKFEIVRPPATLLLARRCLVHDNDHVAPGAPPRWTAKDTGWFAVKQGYANAGKSIQVDWLAYRHLVRAENDLPGARPTPQLVHDELAFNTRATARGGAFPAEATWVGDLWVQCEVKITKPAGEFWLDLTRDGDRFQARFDLASGRCTLMRQPKKGPAEELATAMTSLKAPGTHRVILANCDNRLTLWVGDELPFGDGVVYPPAAVKGPTLDDLEPARIGVKGADAVVEHLQVWRNLYYPGSLDFDDLEWRRVPAEPDRWKERRKPRVRTYYVHPGHYFFLGDNPRASSDSRDWGVVPAQLLGGRLVLRYWPLERSGSIR